MVTVLFKKSRTDHFLSDESLRNRVAVNCTVDVVRTIVGDRTLPQQSENMGETGWGAGECKQELLETEKNDEKTSCLLTNYLPYFHLSYCGE